MPPSKVGPAVGVDVLAEQVHRARLLGELGDFVEHVVQRSAHLLTTGVGHHAEGAVLGAAFHDGTKAVAPSARGSGQVVELRSRGGDVNLGTTALLHLFDHGRQAVQGLGGEHDVHIGRPAAQVLPFLGGERSHPRRSPDPGFSPELLPATELVEHLLLRLSRMEQVLSSNTSASSALR